MAKLTFGKSEPYNNGWRGWSDTVDILLDGKKIGEVSAKDCSQKRYLEYRVCSEHPALRDVGWAFGLKAVKAKVRARFDPCP